MLTRHRISITRACTALVLFFIPLATACTTRPSPLPQPEPAFTLEAPAPTPRPPGAPLLMIDTDRGHQAPQMQALLDRFSEKHGIEVQYRSDGDVAGLLRELLQAGTAPDIILLPIPVWLQEMAAANAIAPLPPEAAEAVHSNFSPAWIEMVSYGGDTYGVPFNASAKSLLWYRPSALEVVDVEPPETLEELHNLAEAFEAQNKKSFAVPGGASWPLTDWFESTLLASAGPAVYDALIDHRLAWTAPPVEEAARHFVELLQPDHVMDGREGIVSTPLLPESFYRALDPQTPGAAMWQGQGSIIYSYLAGGDVPTGSVAVAPFPADEAIITVGSVAVATNRREETTALLTYLAQPETVEPWVRQGGFITPNRALSLDTYPTDLLRREAELLIEAELLRYDLSDLLPPNLRDTVLPDKLREMLLHPEELTRILQEIEGVATREQGSPKR